MESINNIESDQYFLDLTLALAARGEGQVKPNPMAAALAKAFSTSKARETVSWARELLGGNRIVIDYNVARFFADAEAIYSYEGVFQMQNLIIGKAITGFSAFV